MPSAAASTPGSHWRHSEQRSPASSRPSQRTVSRGRNGGCSRAKDYRAELEKHGLRGSMGRCGNSYDNAKAESFMKTLKVEEVS